VWATTTLEDAKIFLACPTSAASLLNAQILVVLMNCDGSGVRRTLLLVPTCASTPGRESLALELIRSKGRIKPLRVCGGDVMDEQKRKRRQEELRRIDAWLQKLHRDPSGCCLAARLWGVLGILIVAMLLRAFLEWLGR